MTIDTDQEPGPDARRQPISPDGGVRALVCLSFCGGGTTSFRRWSAVLPEQTTLRLVCYPGREARFAEPFARTWTELLDDAVATVRASAHRPYALLGHSMGARVAFETVRRLADLAVPTPELLVVSGSDAPSNWSSVAGDRPRSAEDDGALLRWARDFGQVSPELLAEPDLRTMVVELLRADLTVMESYRPDPTARVDVPLHLLYGESDSGDFEAIHRRWQAATTRRCDATRLPGGHFYTPDVWNRLPTYVPGLTPSTSATGS